MEEHQKKMKKYLQELKTPSSPTSSSR
jgi:hypothetical protein